MRRAAAKPRPEAAHRPFVQRSAEDIAELYTAATGRAPVRGRQLHPEVVDPLAASPLTSAARDKIVLDFLPVVLRVDALHNGGEGGEEERGAWVPLVRAFMLDLHVTRAMLAELA